MYPETEDILEHYGMPRRSGRYPWGSGDDPYQRTIDFIGRVEELKKSGKTESEIASELGFINSKGQPATSRLRAQISVAKEERRMMDVATAKSMKGDGLSATEIGRRLGVRESTVRSWLNEESEKRMNEAKGIAEFLKEQVEEKGMIDVGKGVNIELNIAETKLNAALARLENEGYPVYSGGIKQVTNPGQQTTQKVLCKPGTPHKDIYQLDKVHSVRDYISRDGGDTFEKFVYPKSMDINRLMVRYKDDVGPDGARGVDKDGVIEIRRGCKDLSLGTDHYSQVRILVDGDRYLKGMAVYSDDMPPGVDVIFNTNKTSDTPVRDVLKKIKADPDNPFGSLIKPGGQSYYEDEKGNKQLSLINKRAAEGDWSDWKDALPAQFLSKQSTAMAKKQLNLAVTDKLDEFNSICELENPTIKKHLLAKFASTCDSSAVHLQAAALPGQKYHVIIPLNSLKDTEVYAPNYENGTKLALIRYPHGGTFEIPIVTVNNKNKVAKQLLGANAGDAICINARNAERLSGADFDGDTVMCIPTHDSKGKVKITSTDPLKGLEGFDSKSYKYSDEEIASGKAKIMRNTDTEMGKISNLITDMTLQGANEDELARAVRHSMVVIDAEKHELNYKKSELDNNIAALKKKYQPGGGASTLISRSKGEYRPPKTQGTPKVNMKDKPWYDPNKPEGALIWTLADDLEYTITKVNKRTGETTTITKTRTKNSTRMAETDDARTLISEANTRMENIYADYANRMKSLANDARKEQMTTGKIKYDKNAAATYKKEVSSLNTKLHDALLNAPREREALRRANVVVDEKKAADPNMKKKDIKKASQQALTAARVEVDAIARRKRNIDITPKEWEAIQAGAISETTLIKILNNTDIDRLRELATPRRSNALSQSQMNRAKALSNSNYTNEEIAKKLGVSPSTISNYLKGVK